MCIIDNKTGYDFRSGTDELLEQLKRSLEEEREQFDSTEDTNQKNVTVSPKHGHTTCPGCKRCLVCGREAPITDYTITCDTSGWTTNITFPYYKSTSTSTNSILC